MEDERDKLLHEMADTQDKAFEAMRRANDAMQVTHGHMKTAIYAMGEAVDSFSVVTKAHDDAIVAAMEVNRLVVRLINLKS